MKRILFAVLVCLLFGVAKAKADSVYAPWYNESSAFDTWLLFSNVDQTQASGDFTLIARNASGTVVGSTTPTIGAGMNWSMSLATAITDTTSTGNSTGTLEIVGSDSVLNNLNIFVVVQGTADGSAGFVVPVYGGGVTTGNKYAPQ